MQSHHVAMDTEKSKLDWFEGTPPNKVSVVL